MLLDSASRVLIITPATRPCGNPSRPPAATDITREVAGIVVTAGFGTRRARNRADLER